MKEKPKLFDEEDLPIILHIPHLTVFEQESSPTGLLDSEGRPLMRKREPIGFIK